MLERIANDPQAFILEQGWPLVQLDGVDGVQECARYTSTFMRGF
jgi:hypothetical protein